MAITLGLGGSLHDFSACLINDNNEIIAIEDERLSRIRYGLGEIKPHVKSVEYCLEHEGINLNEVDRLVGDDMISDDFFPSREKINHHLAHAMSVFLTSQFDSAAILVLDGVGSEIGDSEARETTTYALGRHNDIFIIDKVYGSPSHYRHKPKMPRVRSNSLGEFYRLVTEMIGFDFLDAGKTMGLYSYGDDRFLDIFLGSVLLESKGQYQILVEGDNGLIAKIQQMNILISNDNSFDIRAAIASAAQRTLEIIVKHCLAYLWSVTKVDNLCLAGGVVLNSVMNGKITTMSKFKNIHIISAPGDNGAAIGSAIYGRIPKNSSETYRINFSPYLGKTYSKAIIQRLVSNFVHSSPTNLGRHIAELLHSGLVVAICQGRSEFGPRALGNRSILADPSIPNIKDRMNKLKGREFFRPVAPAVILENLHEYFEAYQESPYMQYVFPVREQYINKISGAVHVDNTARVQSVTSQINPFFYSILIEFGNMSGVPILINTSFNIKGQPIVETPEDALDAFINSDLDVLVIDEFVLKKKQ